MKTILFLFTFSISSSWALPGMTNVQMNFSNLEGSLSTEALKCVKANSSEKGLAVLSNYLNKIDCNSKSDPKEFCECIAIISKDKFNLSAEKEIKVVEYVKNMIAQRNILKAKEHIYNSDSFLNLSMTISGTNLVDKCLSPSVSNQNIQEVNNSRSDAKASINQQAKVTAFDDIVNELKNTHFDRGEELIQLNALMISLKETKSEAIDWERLSTVSPYFKMMSKNKRRNFLLSKQLSAYPEFEDISYAVPNVSLRGVSLDQRSVFKLGLQKLKSDQNKMLTKNFANKIVEGECREFRKVVDNALSFNLDEQYDVMMKSVINPETKEDFATLEKIESFLAKNLADDDITKKLLLFDIDKLYCSKKELTHVFQSLEINEEIIKSKSATFKTFDDSLKLLHGSIEEASNELEAINNELAYEQESLENSHVEQAVFTSLSKGEFSKVVDGIKVIDLENEDLRNLLNNCDSQRCDPLLTAVGLVPHISYDEFKPELDMILKGYEETSVEDRQKKIDVLTTRQKDVQAKLSRLNQGYSDLNKGRNAFIADLKKEFGDQGYSEIIASSEVGRQHMRSFNQNVGLTTSRKSRRQRVQDALSKLNFEVNEKAYVTSTNSTPKKLVQDSLPIQKPSIIKSEGVISSLGKYFKAPGAVTDNTQVNTIVSKVEQEDQQQKKSEIEDAIARLEKLVSENSEKTKLSSSSQSAEDKEIENLKNKIELEKLNIEKANLEKKIAQTKSEKSNLQQKKALAKSNDTNSLVDPASKNSSRPASFETLSASTGASFNSSKSASSSLPVSSAVPSAPAASSGAVSSSSVSAESISASTTGSEARSSRAPASSSFSLLEDSSSSFEIVNLSDLNNTQRASDSRVVKIDFMFNKIDSSEREAFIKNLFYSGEDSLILELPDGEKLFVENNQVAKTEKTGQLKRAVKDEKEQRPKRSKDDRKRYVDLKKLLKVGTSQQEFE
ncbi:hypothetical protein [Halobacteriovorax sp. HLS]|uniref:hypothetical protein n=1 Tax=Halobacteriovorax sp. HLS TaxID=2234000 RepID=UPI000FD74D33|nr:hypothetical protein [Halobacteriovorax sp. HLS]